MATEHLSRHPYSLNACVWLYEEKSGLTLWESPEPNQQGKGIGTIPWSKVRDALARHDKPRAKGAR